MPVDAGIYNQVTPLPDPGQQFAQDQELKLKRQQQQQSLQMDALKLQQAKSTELAQAALDNAMSNALKPDGSIDVSKLAEGVKGTPAASELPKIQESLLALQAKAADVAKTKGEVAKQERDHMAAVANAADSIPEAEQPGWLLTHLAQSVKAGAIDSDEATSILSQMIDPSTGQPDPGKTKIVLQSMKALSSGDVKDRAEAAAAAQLATTRQLEQPGVIADVKKKQSDALVAAQVAQGTQGGLTPEQQAQGKREAARIALDQQRVALEAKRLALSGGAGSAVDPESVAYWVRQVKNDPTVLSQLTGNKPLKQAVENALPKDGGNLDKLSAQSKAMKEIAGEILPHITKIKEEAKDINALGLMGPIRGRWRDFATQKVGAQELVGGGENARKVGKFQTDIGLLMTAVARAHGGARGGGSPAMLEHMKDIMDAHGKDLDVFLGNLDSAKDWMQGYSTMGESNTPLATPATSGSFKVIGSRPAPK